MHVKSNDNTVKKSGIILVKKQMECEIIVKLIKMENVEKSSLWAEFCGKLFDWIENMI